MFTLQQPSMAINDPRVSFCKYSMYNTWNIKASESREQIADWVATVAKGVHGGKLKNLVINCHGNNAWLGLGQGFLQPNLSVLKKWKGLIEVIWLPCCKVAKVNGAYDGYKFCMDLAQFTGAVVVASPDNQRAFGNYGYGKVDTYEGLMVIFSPQGYVSDSVRFPSFPVPFMGF